MAPTHHAAKQALHPNILRRPGRFVTPLHRGFLRCGKEEEYEVFALVQYHETCCAMGSSRSQLA